MPIHNDTIARGITSASPTAAYVNKIGTPVASISGTPSRQSIWTLTIQTGANSSLIARVLDDGAERRKPVKVSTSHTDLIPGLTITLHSSLNHGDMASILYTREYVVNT